MKQFYHLKISLFASLMLAASLLFSQTYVNHTATGNNDGSSWANAYTSLKTALENTNSGDIWIAAGTYRNNVSAEDDSTATLRITSNISLFGGFLGTETSFEERNPMDNMTIISGDVNDDDIPENTLDNREDNNRHIIYVDSLLTGPVTFDGLIFEGGHTGSNGDLDLWHRAGGGIYSYSPVAIDTCLFRYNYGRSGAGVYLLGDASGSSFFNAAFIENRTTSQSAGIMLNAIDGVTIENCTFANNETIRGALYPLRCSNLSIDSCFFVNNVNSTGFAGAMFVWSNTGLTVSNSSFFNNSSANAACVYNDGREIGIDPTNSVWTNCHFENNVSTSPTGSGGGMSCWRASMTLENCSFINNTANGSAGQFSGGGADKHVIMNGCTFEGGVSNGWGGAMTAYGENSTYEISDTYFENNTCPNLGGAINAGFTAHLILDECTFEGNFSANSSGGAVSLQNDSTRLTATYCDFLSNSAVTGSGGAIYSGWSNMVNLDGCFFETNEADFGGAVFTGENDDDISSLTLTNSFFNFNLAQNQGGGLNLSNADATISNTIFANNIASGNGTGGAISNNASDSNTVVVNIVNTTFVDNIGVLSSGIAQWTGDNEAVSDMNVQNSIFRQDGGLNYGIEAGTPNLTSTGGNLSDDDSLEPYFTDATDLFDLDPLFVDIEDFDYSLLAGSPCINAGVAANAPDTDIEGNPRDATPDIGAYEFQGVGIDETLVKNNGMLEVFPNPVTEATKLKLDNQWMGELQVRVINMLGQEMFRTSIQKFAQVAEYQLNLNQLSAGIYEIMVSNGKEVVVQKVTK